MLIWFASGNAHKKREIEALLKGRLGAVELRIPGEAGIPFEPEENGAAFLDNALIKARSLRLLLDSRGLEGPVLADDSGLCVDALGGRPGVHSARYGGGAGQAERNRLLLAETEGCAERGARFVCALVLLYSGDRFYAVQETLEGELLRESRGGGGFGYDPLLYLPELGRTVAELTEEEKNTLSHRGKAGRALARFLEDTPRA
ncbi:MAG: non-canonical purine NTP pyrophosphatase [Spirochaetaceae bacterium]|jgi:XTP/dITP diphosphohydrolase|nr:non-canonical purine NTP pyrophosphatase [Spirochaetaceae bacterium]